MKFGDFANGTIPPDGAPDGFVYLSSSALVGSRTWDNSVRAGRLPPTTSLPISANPIALTRNASSLSCSSTMLLLRSLAFAMAFTRSVAPSE